MSNKLVTAIGEDGPEARWGLSDAERTLCEGLPAPSRQRDFRAGRLAAKRAARAALGSKSAFEILPGESGAPELSFLDRNDEDRDAPVCISISHRDGRAVAAVVPEGMRVGVDLERCQSVTQDMADYFLNPEERPIAPFGDLTILWSLKEAVWKALELDREMPFKSVRLATASDGGLMGAYIGDVYVPLRARLTFPWPGYHMATVWTEHGNA